MVWIFGAIALAFDLAEEIAGDAMDMEGDKKRGSRSLAILHGKQAASRISGALFIVMILLSLVPIILSETSLAYILPIGLMDVAIVFLGVRLMKSTTQGRTSGDAGVIYQCHYWVGGVYIELCPYD